jgi:hypothetical protein
MEKFHTVVSTSKKLQRSNPGGPEGDTVTVAEKLLNTEYRGNVQVQRKYGLEPSNRVCGARGAAAHACAPGLSTGRRLMPMPVRCGAAAPCRGAATVRRSPHTRRVLRRVLLGRGCLCGAHRARATASTTKRLHACACEGADENSWQSRPRHACALGAGRRLAARNRAGTYYRNGARPS